MEKFHADLTRSCERYEQRLRGVPKLTFDDTLPVVLRKDEIAAAIRRLHGDAALRERMRAAGLALTAGETWQDRATALLSLAEQAHHYRPAPAEANLPGALGA